jgi:acetyl/propionyl-CoA carboxylase alpha subunit
MLFLAKNVYAKYCPLIVKIHFKSTKSEIALKNLNALCDVEIIFGLSCILPFLKCVHTLIKFAQGKGVFIYNFVDIINLAQQELFKLY